MDTTTFLADKYTIFKGYAGSMSYGTNLPTSDVDVRGLFCADPINIRTPFFPVREVDDGAEEDTKLYELTHFMKLCLDCNPNIIEMLWIDEADIISRSPGYDLLRKHRAKLLSAKIAFTTSGYAMAQLKRIKGHNKWINNPQSEVPPQHIDYVSLVQWYGKSKVLPREFDPQLLRDNTRLIPYGGDLFGVYHECTDNSFNTYGYQMFSDTGSLNTLVDNVKREELPPPLALIKFNKNEYLVDKDKFKNFWTWKNNRNETRSELEHEHGYDTKHAMHLVRLMRMGQEALEHGHILVKRPDAEELLSIRAGHWSYEDLLEYAAEMDGNIRDVWYKKTKLPKKPDLKYAADLLMRVQDSIWHERGLINTISTTGI